MQQLIQIKLPVKNNALKALVCTTSLFVSGLEPNPVDTVAQWYSVFLMYHQSGIYPHQLLFFFFFFFAVQIFQQNFRQKVIVQTN